MRFVFVCFLDSFCQIVVVGRGGADIVEQFRDLEFGCSFFFCGQFLDRLACGLKLGLFRGTCNVQLNCGFDFGVQDDGDVMQAQVFDRAAQNDLFAVDGEAFGCSNVCRVTGRNRTVKRTRIGGGADDDELLTVKLVGQCFGFFFVSRFCASSWAF